MRYFLELAFVVVTALLIGGGLSMLSIQSNLGFGAAIIGQWSAWPQAGSRNADPYTKAKVAAAGEVPLGAAEGIAFHAKTDNRGEPLRLECTYRDSGNTPQAPLWTLTAHDPTGAVVASRTGKASTLISRGIVRDATGRFLITVSPVLAGGNWIETHGVGPFELIFRLYDTPSTSTSGLNNPEMPELILAGCKL